MLRLPVLVAWKCLNSWVLIDLAHLEASGSIEFTDALPESLMCELCGDFVYGLVPGVGLHVEARFTKHQESGRPYEGEEIVAEGRWEMVVDAAYYTDGHGRRHSKLQRGFLQLLMAAQLEESREVRGGRVYQRSVAAVDFITAAHRVLAASRFARAARDVRWRRLFQSQDWSLTVQDIREAVQAGKLNGTIRATMIVHPRTLPEFLRDGRASSA